MCVLGFEVLKRLTSAFQNCGRWEDVQDSPPLVIRCNCDAIVSSACDMPTNQAAFPAQYTCPTTIPYRERTTSAIYCHGPPWCAPTSLPPVSGASIFVANICGPIPISRAFGDAASANSHPQGGDPNSQARTSPMTKPTAVLLDSATRKCRSLR